jgi:hypothetical protein
MNPLTLILNPRVFLILVMVVLMGLVFSLGNRLGLGPLARYLIMAGILLLIVLVVILWRLRKRRKESETIEHSMIMEAAPPPDAGEEEKRERERAKRELAEAVATLKRSPVAGGGSALAVLPWYLVLGAAESGKSALIRQSGLPFPGTGGEEFQGVSDAVNCDWWFTNQAVILEAKRRFLEAGDEADEDWRTFLGFLGKARPRVPLNGVVVTVAADALMAGEAADLEARAGRLRQRLDAPTAWAASRPSSAISRAPAATRSGAPPSAGATWATANPAPSSTASGSSSWRRPTRAACRAWCARPTRPRAARSSASCWSWRRSAPACAASPRSSSSPIPTSRARCGGASTCPAPAAAGGPWRRC